MSCPERPRSRDDSHRCNGAGRCHESGPRVGGVRSSQGLPPRGPHRNDCNAPVRVWSVPGLRTGNRPRRAHQPVTRASPYRTVSQSEPCPGQRESSKLNPRERPVKPVRRFRDKDGMWNKRGEVRKHSSADQGAPEMLGYFAFALHPGRRLWAASRCLCGVGQRPIRPDR